jgi:hypothetical protein
MRAAIIVAALTSITFAHAETLTCTDRQGIRTCQDGHGYVSHEMQWQDRTYGDDSDGDHWLTSRWQGRETTTVEPPALGRRAVASEPTCPCTRLSAPARRAKPERGRYRASRTRRSGRAQTRLTEPQTPARHRQAH